MKPYRGEKLAETARVGVIANDALGNFVVATPLLQMLRAANPNAELFYFGGVRTKELEEASDLIDVSVPLHGTPLTQTSTRLTELANSFDLVVNLERSELAMTAAPILVKETGYWAGPSLSQTGRTIPDPEHPTLHDQLLADNDWMSPTLTEKYPFLNSGFIGEIFCRLAHLEGPVPRYRVANVQPSLVVPEVLIATAATSQDKLWAKQNWVAALEWMQREGLSAGLLGAPPKLQREYWKGECVEDDLVSSGLVKDLRGAMTLPEVVGALSAAKAVLTLDNGILHLTAATDTPTVGLFRNGIHRLWAPPAPNLSILEPGPGGQVADIEPQTAIEAIKASLFELSKAGVS